MAQTGYTPILIYSSSTAANVPLAGNLTNSALGSELAINITDGKLFYKDNANNVQVIGWKTVPTSAGGTGLTSYTAGDLLYYASGTTLTQLAIGASTTILTSSGTAPQWSAASGITVGTATNLAGGVAGSLPYQSGVGATTFVGIGAANTVLTSSGSAPQWSSSLTVSSINSTDATFTNDISINGQSFGKGTGTGTNNIAIGNNALDSATTASGSIAIGFEALTAATTSGLNTAVGYQAFKAYNSTEACAFGYQAGLAATGGRNHLFGYQSGRNITTGFGNCAFGHEVNYYLTTGSYNSFYGYGAGYSTTGARLTGSYNCGFGFRALYTASTGSENIGIGREAGNLITSGANNTFVGSRAGNTATTGNNNACFGYNAQVSAAGVSNEYTYGDANVTAHRFTGGNLVVANGNGIDFSATPGTGTSELLADYEEGAFTPTIVGTTTAGTGTYAANGQIGKYTKIGNRVYFTIWLSWTAHTGTGNMRVDGLPFTCANISGLGGALSYWMNNITLLANYVLTPYVVSNSTQVALEQYQTGGSGPANVAMDTSAALALSGHYEV